MQARQQQDWKSTAGLCHGFYTRHGGMSKGLYQGLNCGLGSGDDPTCVRGNIRQVADDLGLTDCRLLLTLRQVHSSRVVQVDQDYLASMHGDIGSGRFDVRPQADAWVTALPNVTLAVLTADCAPVLMCDPHQRIVAAAHAGWKGALEGVLENTFAVMQRLGASAQQTQAVVGPAIAQSSYQVGGDYRAQFIKANIDYADYFQPSSSTLSFESMEEKFQFDLKSFVRDRLLSTGIRHVGVIEDDTYAQAADFFSYRRSVHQQQADYGRQISCIMWKNDA